MTRVARTLRFPRAEAHDANLRDRGHLPSGLLCLRVAEIVAPDAADIRLPASKGSV